jgi:arginine exporter protein ArgO
VDHLDYYLTFICGAATVSAIWGLVVAIRQRRKTREMRRKLTVGAIIDMDAAIKKRMPVRRRP